MFSYPCVLGSMYSRRHIRIHMGQKEICCIGTYNLCDTTIRSTTLLLRGHSYLRFWPISTRAAGHRARQAGGRGASVSCSTAARRGVSCTEDNCSAESVSRWRRMRIRASRETLHTYDVRQQEQAGTEGQQKRQQATPTHNKQKNSTHWDTAGMRKRMWVTTEPPGILCLVFFSRTSVLGRGRASSLV